MPCNHIQDLLPEYVLQLLDADDQEQVEQHLASGCFECDQALREFREVTAMIPAITNADTPLAPPAELKQELMRRVREVPAAVRPVRVPKSRWMYAAYAAAACVAFVVGVYWQQGPPPITLTHAEREALYQQRMAEIQRSFDASTIRLATAARNSTGSDKQGAVVWDPEAHEVHLFAFGLTAPSDGVLQAWVVDAGDRYTPAGSLDVSERGDVAQVLAVPPSVGEVANVIVTREASEVSKPLPEGQSPTGEVVLVAPFDNASAP
jgi:anti-sigma-K factor RskA